MFRVLLSLVIFVVLFIYITLLNPQSVHIRLYKDIAYTLPLSVLIIIIFTLGFVVACLLNIIRGTALSMALSSLKRKLSAQSTIKNKMAEALCLSEIFSPEAAIGYLKLKKLDKDPFLFSVYGRLLRRSGNLDEAKSVHIASKKEASDFSYPLYEFVSDLYEEERFTEVVSIVKDMDKRLLSPLILYLGALAARESGDYSMATSFAERLSKFVDHNSVQDFLLGLKVEKLKKDKDLSGIKKILKKRPDFIPALFALIENNETKTSVKAVKEAYNKTKDITYLMFLVDLMVKREGVDPSKTIDFVKGLISEKDERVSVVLAYLYAQIGMYDEASKIISDVSSDSAFVNLVKAKIMKGMKKFEECCHSIGSALDISVIKYRCSVCGEIYSDLVPFCKKCKNYNTIKLEVS